MITICLDPTDKWFCMGSPVGFQHHKGTEARLARQIASDIKFLPRFMMGIVMERANINRIEENLALQLCCKRIKGYGLIAITLCNHWYARRDSNRPTDSKSEPLSFLTSSFYNNILKS